MGEYKFDTSKLSDIIQSATASTYTYSLYGEPVYYRGAVHNNVETKPVETEPSAFVLSLEQMRRLATIARQLDNTLDYIVFERKQSASGIPMDVISDLSYVLTDLCSVYQEVMNEDPR